MFLRVLCSHRTPRKSLLSECKNQQILWKLMAFSLKVFLQLCSAMDKFRLLLASWGYYAIQLSSSFIFTLDSSVFTHGWLFLLCCVHSSPRFHRQTFTALMSSLLHINLCLFWITFLFYFLACASISWNWTTSFQTHYSRITGSPSGGASQEFQQFWYTQAWELLPCTGEHPSWVDSICHASFLLKF